MKWYNNLKLLVVILAALIILVAGGLVLMDKVEGSEALKFIGTGVFSLLIGFLAGRQNGVKSLLLLFALSGLLVGGQGCATTQEGKTTIDTCKALAIGDGAHQTAAGISAIVCHSLKGEQRAECLRYQREYSALGEAILGLGASVIKACGI